MSRTTSNRRFLLVGPMYLSSEDIPGLYGSRTGADDLRASPKPLAAVPFGKGRLGHFPSATPKPTSKSAKQPSHRSRVAVIGHAKLHREGTVVEDDSLGAGPVKAHPLFRAQRLGPAP